MKVRKYKQGFTIFELLAVLTVMAILSAIAVPKVFALVRNSRYKSDLITIANIEKAEEQYFFINKEHSFDPDVEQTAENFPDSLTNLADYIENVNFQIVTDVRWKLDGDKWYIAYSYGESEDPPDDPPSPYPEWDSTAPSYQEDYKVTYNSAVFIARHWVGKGVVPGTLGAPWQELTTEWRNFNRYLGGDIVTYNGAEFEAWHNMSPDYSKPIPTPGTVGAPWQELTTEWRNFNKYKGKDIVAYNGAQFEAWHDTGPWTGPTPTPGIVGAPWQELTTEWRNFNKYQGGDPVTYNGVEYTAAHNIVPSEGHPVPTPGESSFWH